MKRLLILGLLLWATPSWAADVAVVQAAARTTSGNQSFTSTGFGQPVAAMFIISRASVTDTVTAAASMAIGFTDGTRNVSTGVRAEDNVATTDTSKRYMTDKAIFLISPTDGTVEGEANFNAWVTDGVELNWTTAPGTGWLVTAILFGGTGITNAYTAHGVSSASIGGTVDVTAPGFQPDVVIVVSPVGSFTVDTETATASINVGAVVRGAGNPHTQRSAAVTMTSGVTTPASCLVVDTNSVHRASTNATGEEVEITDFDSSGFTLTTREVATASRIIYLALKLSGITASLQTITFPTGTGNASITGTGATPQFVLLAQTSADSTDARDCASGDSETFGLGAFTSSAAGVHGFASQDAAGVENSATASIADTKPVNQIRDDATFMEATFVSMDSDGWTLNYSTANGTARKGWGLAFSTATATPAHQSVILFQ